MLVYQRVKQRMLIEARLLLHLFTRQHLLMRSCRTVAAVTQLTQPEGQGMAVSLQSLTADGKLSFEVGTPLGWVKDGKSMGLW